MIELFGREYAHEKQYRRGTHRTRTPRETLDDYSVFMPQMGITRLANLTGLDRLGLPVYTAVRPNATSWTTAQGNGLDRDSAKASAMVESMELWHAENIRNPTRHESYLSLREHAAVADITRMVTVPGQQARLDVRRSWVEGWDLMSGSPTWVPHDCATLNTVFANGYLPTFRISPAGLAGGNHILEASVHALCELIEHDAAVEWRTNRALHQIDLSEIQDPQCAWILDKLYRGGVRVIAWDMTNAIGIPAVAAAILEKPYLSNWRSLGVAYGCGCHLSPAIALMRAINEAVQTRLTHIAASRDDLYDDDYARNRDLDYTLQVWEESARPTSFSSFHLLPDNSTETFEGDIEVLLGALRRAGIESVMAVDLTKPEIGIPVVKMVAPGLRQSVRQCQPAEVAA